MYKRDLTINGKSYKLLKKVGIGGMAKVFQAEDAAGNVVAIKISNVGHAQKSKNHLQRHEKEVKSLREIKSSKYLLKFYDATSILKDDAPDGLNCLVTEYVDGVTLKEFISKKPLSIEQFVKIMPRVVKGLGKIHSSDYLHRDIKDANIMLDNNLNVKIIDFGIAKRSNKAQTNEITTRGALVATLNYVSPELVSSKEPKASFQTDIFALGITMFSSLTATLPFSGESQEEIVSNIRTKPIPYGKLIERGVPDKIINLIKNATKKDPSDRYKSVRDLYDDLISAKTDYEKSTYFK